MPAPLADLRSLFCEALERPSPEARADYLDQACKGQPALRSRLDALLQAQAEVSGFLQEPAKSPASGSAETVREGPGTILGPYKLLEQIGEGGFGLVFMAEQRQPVRRKVAVKILKPGMDTQQVIARFEAERQALALMDHANIVKVLDAGETSSGRPYFVMELYRGVPITAYCDQNALTPRERLELFGSVCQAVQHAHHKGLIHRDIKPSNVLVTVHDGAPVVKIIDFGIAKALGQQLTDKTLFTGYEQLLGTPLYMSPEQAGMGDLDIDTRTDIYSLGVLLYELLTGLTPFDKDRLQGAGHDMRRIIREEEPPKPSTRFSTVGQAGTTISARRKSDPRRLCQLFRGELDWMVMKALEKDRGRRYQTASAFAADVQCYLHDEPVTACPPSVVYRCHKFARRHKGSLRAAAAASLAMLLAAGGVGWTIRDREARQAATVQLADEAAQQATELLKQKKWAEARIAARRAEALLSGVSGKADQRQRVQLLLADLDMVARLEEVRLQLALVKDNQFNLWQADPEYARAFEEYGIDVDRLEVGLAAERIAARPIPVELAAALDDWARVRKFTRPRDEQSWKRLLAIARGADPDPWRLQLRSALEKQDLQVLQALAATASVPDLPPVTLVNMGFSLRNAGAFQEATILLRQAQEHYPEDFWINYELAATVGFHRPGQTEEAIRFLTVAAALRPQSPGVLLNLGVALGALGRHEESIAVYQRAIRLQPNYAAAHGNLALALESLRRRQACLAVLADAFQPRPNFAPVLDSSRRALQDRRQRDAVLSAFNEAIRVQPNFAPAYNNLGNTLQGWGRLDEACAAYRDAIRAQPEFAMAHNGLGKVLMDRQRPEDAIAAFQEAVRIEPDLAMAHGNLGIVLFNLNRLDESMDASREAIRLDPTNAEAYNTLAVALVRKTRLDEAIDVCKQVLRRHPHFARAHNTLGAALEGRNELGLAIAEYRASISFQPDYVMARVNLGNALRKDGQLKQAVAAYQEVIALEPNYAEVHYELGKLWQALGEYDAALAAYDTAIRWRPGFAQAYCNRGQVLKSRGRFAEALLEYRRGHELGSRTANWPYRSARWVEDCERLTVLNAVVQSCLDWTRQCLDHIDLFYNR